MIIFNDRIVSMAMNTLEKNKGQNNKTNSDLVLDCINFISKNNPCNIDQAKKEVFSRLAFFNPVFNNSDLNNLKSNMEVL